MGVLGGLQVLRAHNNKNFVDPNVSKNLFYSIVPYNFKSETSHASIDKMKNNTHLDSLSIMEKIWRRRVDFNASVYIGMLCTLPIISFLLDTNYPFETIPENTGNL